MFPPKILDLSRLHTRPTRKPSSYAENKVKLQKLWRQRQKQLQEQRISASKNLNPKLSNEKVRTIFVEGCKITEMFNHECTINIS